MDSGGHTCERYHLLHLSKRKFCGSQPISIRLGTLRAVPYFWPRRPQSLPVPLCYIRYGYAVCRRHIWTHPYISNQKRTGLYDLSQSDQHLYRRQGPPLEYTWVEFDGLRVREALSITGLSHDAPVYHARSHDMRETMMQEMLYIARHGDMPPFHLIGPLVPLPGCPDPLCLSHGPLHLQGRETPGLLYT